MPAARMRTRTSPAPGSGSGCSSTRTSPSRMVAARMAREASNSLASDMTHPVPTYRLEGISPRAFQHPADRAATAALRQVPHLDAVVRKLIELGYERALRQAALGSAVRAGQHP